MSARDRAPRGTFRASRRRQDGYSLIEVVMAMAILTTGAVGIMALQQASTRGNLEARQLTTGTVLAQRWVDRLRRDSVQWTAGTRQQPVPPTLLGNTTYLQNVPAVGAAANWFVPDPPAGGGEEASFDFYGNDTAVAADMRYCTNVRLEWLYPGQAIRADVRVWWIRRQPTAANANAAQLAGCAPGLAANDLSGDRRTRSVYMTTVLRYVPR